MKDLRKIFSLLVIAIVVLVLEFSNTRYTAFASGVTTITETSTGAYTETTFIPGTYISSTGIQITTSSSGITESSTAGLINWGDAFNLFNVLTLGSGSYITSGTNIAIYGFSQTVSMIGFYNNNNGQFYNGHEITGTTTLVSGSASILFRWPYVTQPVMCDVIDINPINYTYVYGYGYTATTTNLTIVSSSLSNNNTVMWDCKGY
jgi:hypothetical protein